MPHYFVSFEPLIGPDTWMVPPSACWVTARSAEEAEHRARVKLSKHHIAGVGETLGGGHLGRCTTLVEIGPEEFDAYQRRYREALDAAGIDWRGMN